MSSADSKNGKLLLSQSISSKSLSTGSADVSSEQVELISEFLLYIYVNEQLAGKVVCTPTFLPELITGRLMTENGINPESIDSIHILEQHSKAKVFVDPAVWENVQKAEDDIVPTCCTDNATLLRANKGGATLEPIPEHSISSEQLNRMSEVILARLSEDTELHKVTRSSHSCFVIKDGIIIFEAEDIGRHNAVDKAVGYICRNGIDPMTAALFTTGRMPVDMVRKVIRASVPVLISRQQPTVQSVDLAASYGLTLIGNLRKDRLNIYSGY